MKIQFAVNNRQNDTADAVKKLNFGFLLVSPDGAIVGPFKALKSVPAHSFKKMEVEVPDGTYIAVHCFWRDEDKKRGTSVVLRMDSSSHGKPWSVVFLGFDAMSVNSDTFEAIDGGFARFTNDIIEMI